MKLLRKGAVVESEEMEPGDILIIEDKGMPIGHVAIVPSKPTEEWKGLYADEDIDWDEIWDDNETAGDE